MGCPLLAGLGVVTGLERRDLDVEAVSTGEAFSGVVGTTLDTGS